MHESDWLRLLSLSLLLAVVIAMRWWPAMRHRKFDWKLFQDKKRKQDPPDKR